MSRPTQLRRTLPPSSANSCRASTLRVLALNTEEGWVQDDALFVGPDVFFASPARPHRHPGGAPCRSRDLCARRNPQCPLSKIVPPLNDDTRRPVGGLELRNPCASHVF